MSSHPHSGKLALRSFSETWQLPIFPSGFVLLRRTSDLRPFEPKVIHYPGSDQVMPWGARRCVSLPVILVARRGRRLRRTWCLWRLRGSRRTWGGGCFRCARSGQWSVWVNSQSPSHFRSPYDSAKVFSHAFSEIALHISLIALATDAFAEIAARQGFIARHRHLSCPAVIGK